MRMVTEMGALSVLFIDADPLLLSCIRRDGDGKITSGYVENGDWLMKIIGGQLGVFDGNDYVVSQCSVKESVLIEVPVPSHVTGNYNEIIEWARGQLPPCE